MLYDLFLLYSATMIITGLILLVATGFDIGSIAAIWIFGAPIFGGLLVVSCILLGNRIRVKYVLDSDGAGGKVSRRMSKLNRATVILGALAGSPGVTGAGLLAFGGEQVFIPWCGVVSASYDSMLRVITLYNGWRSVQRLFCHEDNYEEVYRFLDERLPGRVSAGGLSGS